MKKKSTSKLAFFSLRVLPGLVAAAFIAFALASSHAVGDTLSCPTPQTVYWLGSPTPSPAPPPQLWTELYLPIPTPSRPVLVFRGCNAGHADWCAWWPADASYYVLGQEIRGNCLAGPFKGDVLFKFDQDDGHAMLANIDAQGW